MGTFDPFQKPTPRFVNKAEKHQKSEKPLKS